VDSTGSAARFQGPCGIAVDRAGDLYVADYFNFTIRKVTRHGVVTTLAGCAGECGSVDGTGTAARFEGPWGIAVDRAGNLYVADRDDHTLRKVTSSGTVTTLAGSAGESGNADGKGSLARFNSPTGVAVDSAGNVFVSDWSNYTIRKVTPEGVVTTLAGLVGEHGSADGTGSTARFYCPKGVAVEKDGNVYVADEGNSILRKVTSAGVVTTLGGGCARPGCGEAGNDTPAPFTLISELALDKAGNLYFTDSRVSGSVYKVTSEVAVTTPEGNESAERILSRGQFSCPGGVAVDDAGNVYVTDLEEHIVAKGKPLHSATNRRRGQKATHSSRP
jgi:streptogramin lyase